jgi:hypothetical protein
LEKKVNKIERKIFFKFQLHIKRCICQLGTKYLLKSWNPYGVGAVQSRGNEASKTVARNSEINPVLMNSTQALFALL